MDFDENHFFGQLPSTTGLSLPNIEGLYLDLNQLSGPIPNSISNASRLVRLVLSSNFLSSFIPDCLGKLKSLKILNLSFNFLVSKEPHFLSSLRNCKHLEEIELSDNPFLNIKIPSVIGNISSLTQFIASNCTIKGSIPSEISNLSNLMDLELAINQLSRTIPSSIGRLHKLQGLFLTSNKLQGSIPFDLCHMESLSVLFLDRNELFGSIPSCIDNLTSLATLYLGYNNLSSTIPSSLWNLKNILEFFLPNNSILGSLPLDFFGKKVITMVDFSTNKLSGNIPTSIGDFQSLIYLILSENRLEGVIPPSLSDMASLEYLDLSSNNLLGIIPKSMEKLKYLEYLNVSFNKLEGEIPQRGLFANFTDECFLGNKALYSSTRLKLLPCQDNIQKHKKEVKLVLNYIFLVFTDTTLVIVACIVLCRRNCRHNAIGPLQGDSIVFPKWRRLSYHELECAIDGFQEHNLVGTRSFGSVYKGTLSDGMSVAIKVFNLQIEEAFKSFDVLCQVLQKLRHQNLVKIITIFSNPNFKAIVMEFMPNGSLDKWLYSHNFFSSVLQRLSIMLDIALALEYLHHEYDILVVHCDLKPVIFF